MFLSGGFNLQSENLSQAATPSSDLGIIGEGGARAPLGSLDCFWDPEVSSLGVLSFLLESYYAFEAVLEPGSLDPEIVVWNPEEPIGSSLDHEIFDWNPEAIGEPKGSSLDFIRRTRNRLGNLGFPH
ncbi:hypothetical protein F2Q68_00039216 [Brassica cretica]|uniref:Uncharacterized protein n=1 Tax=Brassica cretica TaxID=69181 RepID=A0A8S9MK86_BRACR|nr:hypothetical protein F2Q68_00039216 [Brassica cretica]